MTASEETSALVLKQPEGKQGPDRYLNLFINADQYLEQLKEEYDSDREAHAELDHNLTHFFAGPALGKGFCQYMEQESDNKDYRVVSSNYLSYVPNSNQLAKPGQDLSDLNFNAAVTTAINGKQDLTCSEAKELVEEQMDRMWGDARQIQEMRSAAGFQEPNFFPDWEWGEVGGYKDLMVIKGAVTEAQFEKGLEYS